MPVYQQQDFFFKEAKRIGYVARSAFKLLQIHEKHRVIPRGGRILDMGCAPGAWLQVACQLLGPVRTGGLVLGVDLEEVKLPKQFCDSRVRVLRGDVFQISDSVFRSHCPHGFNTILSDMCPHTSGTGFQDSALSVSLAERALQAAVGINDGAEDTEVQALLLKNGSFVVKLLEGSGTQEFALQVKEHFRNVAWVRPKATRPASREVYLVAKGKL